MTWDVRDKTILVTGATGGIGLECAVQLASRGHPILGDAKYGSTRAFPAGIALHARRLVVPHPVKPTEVTIEAPLPDAWPPV